MGVQYNFGFSQRSDAVQRNSPSSKKKLVTSGGNDDEGSDVETASPRKMSPFPLAPLAGWRDGILCCCRHGPFHPHFCSTVFCAPMALAQVMSRLKVNWRGKPTTEENSKSTHTLLFHWTLWVYLLTICAPSLGLVLGFALASFMIVAVWHVRSSLRERYAINEHRCRGCEDIACSVFCNVCSIMQMSRHTARYSKDRNAACFTTSGLVVDDSDDEDDDDDDSFV